MSNFNSFRPNDEELSQSSDEKMDTGSESFRSQDTPNSVLSSDFDDKSLENHVLRLQDPEDQVLRLSEPVPDNKKPKIINKELSDSFITKMSNLDLNSPRPKHLGVSPPKFSSTLVLTTNHPLMGLSSPEDFPDLIPKKMPKEDDKDLSLSSIEDDRQESNDCFYSPQLNTSKNNLYFSENFVTAESFMHDSKDVLPPDVARIEQKERRKIIPRFKDVRESPQRVGRVEGVREMLKVNQSTPKGDAVCIPEVENCSAVAEWCESPSQLRSMPNFELPIELSTNINHNSEPESPSALSSQEDKSAYQALLDPYTGSVALRPTRSPAPPRRRIQLPPEDDRCSLDSVSVSLDSEEEPPEPEDLEKEASDDEDAKRSKSSNTASPCSEPIPEYSAAEEAQRERSGRSVQSGDHTLTCDMKVIEPYKRVISHGGYAGRAALLVFSACHLPDRARPDYGYVMDNLFLYVIWTLDRLVTDEYVLVYLHGSAGGRRLPTFRWLHECYKLIDRRLRKSLKHLYLVHPTFWLKSFVVLTKPFVSSKFFRKMTYVSNLEQLSRLVPVEPNAIPDVVKQFDARR